VTGDRVIRRTPRYWLFVALAALGLSASYAIGGFVLLLGPWYWQFSVNRGMAMAIFGVAAPLWLTLCVARALFLRSRAPARSETWFAVALCALPVSLTGYAFLVRWIELP
jgi:hypothetical protein